MPVTWITKDDLPDPDHEFAEEMAASASWILYKLTAEKYRGVREITEWYGYDDTVCSPCTSGMFDKVLTNYLGLATGDTRDDVIPLRGRPVVELLSVTNGGTVLDPSDVYIVNSAFLKRKGSVCWDLETGVTVTYTYGALPPEAGRQAAITLADELIKYAMGDAQCAFPTGVTSVSRQGIDYAILNPQDFINEGRTGIHSVDLFIHAANPRKATKRPKIFSVNQLRGERYR